MSVNRNIEHKLRVSWDEIEFIQNEKYWNARQHVKCKEFI